MRPMIPDDRVNPRVNFKQAVEALPENIKNEIKAEVWFAQKFARGADCRTAMEQYPGLDQDAVASIHLYTNETILYHVMNEKLRSKERDSRDFKRHFYPYIRLLLDALKILAVAKKGKKQVNRGVTKNLVKEYPKYYQEEGSILWWQFSSCTMKIKALEDPNFLGTTGPRTIFQIHTSFGADISEFSAISSEAEHLLPPGTPLKIDSILNCGGGLTIIQCSDDEDAPNLLG